MTKIEKDRRFPESTIRTGPRTARERSPRDEAARGDLASGGQARRRRSHSAAEVAREDARYRRLQRIIELSIAVIYQDHRLTLGDSIEIVLQARRVAETLFPGSATTFNLIYRPRLMRAISERFGIQEAAPEAGARERPGQA